MSKGGKERKRGPIARTGRRIAKSSWKFFWAGDGMTFRTGRYLGESMLVGLFVGFVVVAFHYMMRFGREWVFEFAYGDPEKWISNHQWISGCGWLLGILRWIHAHPYACIVLPPLGALLGYLLIKRFDSLEHARGTDSAILAYHRRHGYVPPAVMPVKSTASVLTIVSGGSAGYEGPVTLIGASCGSVIASWFGLSARARRILMTAGLSGGIAALFQAPLAGAIFGCEILYSSSDIEYEPILPCFIASSLSYTIHACFFGWDTLFAMPDAVKYDNGMRLLPYFILAVFLAFGARFYISFFRATERRFSQTGIPGWLKVVIGGLVTGFLGVLVLRTMGPEYGIMGTSYPTVDDMLNHASGVTVGCLVAFFFFKAVATSFTVGSGGSGGVFAPAICCGGAIGAAVGMVMRTLWPGVGIHPASFALVGMAGFLASCNRIPITAIVMVSEMSGNHQLLLPAMWVCCISFWLNNGWTLYRSQVHNRDASPVHLV